MSLIVCSECGKEYSDKASACPNCGCPTHAVSEMEYDFIERDIAANREMMRLQDLRNEYDKIHRVPMFVYSLLQLVGVILIIVAIIEFASGNLGKSIVFLIVGGAIFGTSTTTYERNKELEKLIKGQKPEMICPFCKSTDLSSERLAAGSFQMQGKTTVGKNINPLRPFTHTDIRHGNTYTNNVYRTEYVCNNCGKRFTNPQTIWR